MKKIKLNKVEIQSNVTRVDHAEGLILQLPDNHEGRNTWLHNYGKGEEAVNRRRKNCAIWDYKTESAELVS